MSICDNIIYNNNSIGNSRGSNRIRSLSSGYKVRVEIETKLEIFAASKIKCIRGK